MTKPVTPLRIIQISDLHLQAQAHGRLWEVDVDWGLTAVLEQLTAYRWPPDFLLATGDLVQDDDAAYPRLRDALESLGAPVYCLPGNHDVPERMKAILRDGAVCHRRHIIDEYWQFILLDSTLPDSPAGYLADTELDFLDRTLRAYPRHHAMVCLHHPPVSIGGAWLDSMVGNGEDLFAVVDRYPQVRAIVWGHIHQEFSTQRGGMALLGAPSTCLQFKPGVADAQADDVPPGYRWFRLYPDGRLDTGVERVGRSNPA
ncbi:MAG: metallophosphoesterase [Gammaproteobacteria bacterium]|nr:metallophosphoesterase [Gammaproteobacteria bacterium]MCP5425448.1 metallophosphoesterase [Gammaproteobacteria bacterium]MCP5459797.1 metallophosphoesterase [Gammaproteobacteria bacterium]